MQDFLDRISGRERLRILSAIGFWLATYLLFLTWNQLQDEFPSSIWQGRRLLSTFWGAVLFFGFTRLADRLVDRGLRERILLLGGAMVGVIGALILGRATIDFALAQALGETPAELPGHIRFGLVWAGYFACGALAFLSFAPSAGTSREQSTAASETVATPAHEEDCFPEALWVSRGRETARVPVEAIEWIEAEGDYVRLHASTGGGLMRGTLSGLEAQLDPQIFARVHRSAICRKNAVTAMLRKPSGAMAVRLESGAEVPVGRRYRDSVGELLMPSASGGRRISA